MERKKLSSYVSKVFIWEDRRIFSKDYGSPSFSVEAQSDENHRRLCT